MEIRAVRTNTANPRLGVLRGVNYPVINHRDFNGNRFYSIVSSDGRHLDVTLGKGVIADFKAVVRL